MHDADVRPIRPEDGPALVSLWQRVFGDPAELAEGFLRLLPEMGGGVAALRGGRILAAAYVVTGMSLRLSGGVQERCGYIYAVAAEVESRGLGLGMAVTRAAAALGRELGAERICTLPASAGLYPWYERLIGTSGTLYRRETLLDAAPGPAVLPLSPEEYLLRRETLLQDQPHMVLSPAAMAYEALNCRCYGGGLYAVGGGIGAVYREEDAAVVRELLCPPGEAAEPLAAALGSELELSRARLYRPDEEGLPYLAYQPPALPGDLVWDLALD